MLQQNQSSDMLVMKMLNVCIALKFTYEAKHKDLYCFILHSHASGSTWVRSFSNLSINATGKLIILYVTCMSVECLH